MEEELNFGKDGGVGKITRKLVSKSWSRDPAVEIRLPTGG